METAEPAVGTEVVLQARGAYYPQLDFAASAQRQQANGSRTGGTGSGKIRSPAFNLFSLGPTVSFVPDVFGATRRKVEQQEALAENQRYQLAAAYLTLTGNAASQAIDIASARGQLSAAEDIIAQDERDVNLVRREFEVGKVAKSDVLTAESQLENDRTQIPPLRQQLSVARHALSVLVGRSPGVWSAPDFELTEFELPGRLPVSVPSQLVRQRPDILAAEAQLHAASAEVGIATAQMYPTITLSASAGFESLATDTLFNGSSLIWGLASGLSAPLFHGGALVAQRRAAIDALHASLATYEQTILQAFGQVADTLRALQHDSELVDMERSALDTSTASLSPASDLQGGQIGSPLALDCRAGLPAIAARIHARPSAALPEYRAALRRPGRRLVGSERSNRSSSGGVFGALVTHVSGGTSLCA